MAGPDGLARKTPARVRAGAGLGIRCPECGTRARPGEMDAHRHVCSDCGHHFRLGAATRLLTLVDDGRWREHDAALAAADPLAFRDLRTYPERIREGMAATGLRDAAIGASGAIGGVAVELVAMEHRFLGGSLGVVVGEKIVRAAERAEAGRRPLVLVCSSSGARMMEGALSLMQLARIGSALERLDRAGVPSLSLLTDPTTGSLSTSCAMLADLCIAEPGALIGFTPPRLIARTSDTPLPPGFQRAESLLAHGLLDLVVDRRELPAVLGRLLRLLAPAGPDAAAPTSAGPDDLSLD